uniref:ethanolamine-phosphate cytidylyltransferase n=1 Tax=Plectus sambesii TaxID=2011161 RepID=A0A914WX62_9BILA
MDQSYQNMNGNHKAARAYCDGCFDLVHFGHANHIRQAKALCDYLVVGVHSDAEIAHHKGPTVFNQDERYRLVKAIKWTDEIVENAPYSPTKELLDKNNCEVCIHGAELTLNADGTDTFAEVKRLGRYRECKRTEGVSTTDLVAHMLKLTTENSIVEAKDLPDLQMVSVRKNELDRTETIMQFVSDRRPQPGERIVYACGAFDLFHIGHLCFLEEAAKLGDYLIVGIHADDVVEQLNGQNHPIMALPERALSVLSYKPVSEVIIGAQYSVTQDFMESYKIDLVVCGQAEKQRKDPATGLDPFEAPKESGKFKLINSGSNVTTAQIVQRIAANRAEFHLRNEKKLAKGKIAVQVLEEKAA